MCCTTLRLCFNLVNFIGAFQLTGITVSVVVEYDAYLVGCFIFSPFLKLKKLGSAYDGILDTDFKSVIFIAL